MTEPIGKQLPRAKPITLTFYDTLLDWPYRTIFYVRADASEEDCHRLIDAICAVSDCELGQYSIGYQKYVVPDYREKLKNRMPGSVMGTFKWQITFHTEDGRPRKHTIPGRNRDYSIGMRIPGLKKSGKNPDPEHPRWNHFVEVFRELCVTKEGGPVGGHIELGRTGSDWPPKGWKKRR